MAGMIKGIIFDADGMIVHGERFSDRLTREYGIGTEKTGQFFKNEFQLCLVGKADLKQELARYVDEWDWKGNVDKLLDYWFSEEYNKIDERFTPIIQSLRAKGIKTYLATNNEKYRTENLVKDRGLGDWFDVVFSSAYIGSKKPSEEFFQNILDNTGLNKDEMVFWDDDTENTEGALAFGLPVEVYTDFEDFKGKMDLTLPID